MQLASYAYEPGMYEILGPHDCDLPRTTVVREGYFSPSILGYKIRATYYPWLVSNPIVTACLYEGTVVWLAPDYCTPTVLSTSEARIWICFGNSANEQHWGWITCDPYAAEPSKSDPWIKKLTDSVPATTATQTPAYDALLTTPEENSNMTTQSAQEVSNSNVIVATEPMSATGDEHRDDGSPLSRAMAIVRASRDTRPKNSGYKETGTYYEFNTAHDPRAKRPTLSSPMKTSMISEMERINALNLEPSLPKLEDKTSSGWINVWRQNRHVNVAKGGDRKLEFLQSFETINRRQAGKGQQQQKRQQQLQEAQTPGSSKDQATAGTTGSSSEPHKFQ
jgi:hypothetical protein